MSKTTFPPVRAMRGQAIVRFHPYTRTGVIQIPESMSPESVEADIISDNTGYGLTPGTRVGVSRSQGNGTYFDFEGERLCTIGRAGLVLIDTVASPEYAA